jgi:hypothetical protein
MRGSFLLIEQFTETEKDCYQEKTHTWKKHLQPDCMTLPDARHAASNHFETA